MARQAKRDLYKDDKDLIRLKLWINLNIFLSATAMLGNKKGFMLMPPAIGFVALYSVS